MSPSATLLITSGIVECRGYKDKEWTQPGSVAFGLGILAEISAVLGRIGSVLCYFKEGLLWYMRWCMKEKENENKKRGMLRWRVDR